MGIGIDAVEIARFAAVLARRPGVAGRLFTAGERAYASGLANPAPSLAARFAVKEAAMKALGVGAGAFAWTDLEVLRHPSGQPQLAVRGRAAALAAAQGVSGWRISLTHTGATAAAVVAALS